MRYETKRQLISARRTAELYALGKPVAGLLRRFHYSSVLDLNENDTVCIAYPRSGNAWFQSLVACAIFGIDGTFLPDRLVKDLVPDLDYKVVYKRMHDQMVFRSHEYPRSGYQQVVHIVRDPRDVMKSYFRLLGSTGQEVRQSEVLRTGEGLRFGTWQTHTSAWLDNPFDANIHLLRFEDLRAAPEVELAKVISFMGFDRSPEAIAAAVATCAIDRMAEREQQFGWDKARANDDVQMVAALPAQLDTEALDLIEAETAELRDVLGYE